MEGQQTNAPRGKHAAPRVRRLLGNPEPFFPEDTALSEHAQLGMAPDKPDPGGHGGQENPAEALAAPRPVEERCNLPKTIDRPPIVTLGMIGVDEALVR